MTQLKLDKSGTFDNKENKEIVPGPEPKLPGQCKDSSRAPVRQ